LFYVFSKLFWFVADPQALGVLLVVLAALALGVISSTLTGIYSAAVYQFAAEGHVAGGFSAEMIQSAFRVRTNNH